VAVVQQEALVTRLALLRLKVITEEQEIYQALTLELVAAVEQVLLERLEQQTHLVMAA